jgi:2-methylcitrate dehydratase PrpD
MNDGLVNALANVLGSIGRGALSTSALTAAKAKLLHAIGVSLVGSGLAPARAAWSAVATDGSGNCFVFGRSSGLGAPDAAFVNGTTGHCSLLEDCGPGGLREGSHPGPCILPAALAAAGSGGVDGWRFLSALLVGYEAVSRIGRAAPPSIVQRRFRPLAMMGPFGAAAAAATLAGADDRQLAAALAVAANMAGGTTQAIFEGSMESYFQAGIAARNGLLAARLGMSGAVTAQAALEGAFGFFQAFGGAAADAQAMLEPSDHCGIELVGLKRFASCVQNQNTVALLIDGLDAPLAPERIERIRIERSATGTNGLNSPGVSRSQPFDNMLSAQMSARFTAAAAVLRRPVDDPRYFQNCFGDPEVVSLSERIDLEPCDDDRLVVTVSLRDGPDLRLDGSGQSVLFPEYAEVRERFLTRARPVLGEQAAVTARLIDRLEHLEDVRELLASLRLPDAAQPGPAIAASNCTA